MAILSPRNRATLESVPGFATGGGIEIVFDRVGMQAMKLTDDEYNHEKGEFVSFALGEGMNVAECLTIPGKTFVFIPTEKAWRAWRMRAEIAKARAAVRKMLPKD